MSKNAFTYDLSLYGVGLYGGEKESPEVPTKSKPRLHSAHFLLLQEARNCFRTASSHLNPLDGTCGVGHVGPCKAVFAISVGLEALTFENFQGTTPVRCRWVDVKPTRGF